MDLLEGTMADDPAAEAYELLFRWAALKRCRSELVQQIGYQSVLDEANLVFAAVQIILKPAVKEYLEFSAQLGECYEWLCDNASLFASAALLIESAAATIRPELCIDDSDDPLGVTAEIYRSLLDMLEEIETEGSVPSFPLRIEEIEAFYREHVLRKRGK